MTANTVGSPNTAVGIAALGSNIDGSSNTAVGDFALFGNTGGVNNVAVGSAALSSNTVGHDNTAIGFGSLEANTEGSDNTAVGNLALASNSTGVVNTALGSNALVNNVTGNFNIAIGHGAGINLTSTSDNIDIGHPGVSNDIGVIRIGTVGTHTRAFISGINRVTPALTGAVGVVVDGNGQLGTISSARRHKDRIEDIGDRSSSLLKLRPVSFYHIDKTELHYGFVAEELDELDEHMSQLVVRNDNGETETIKYHEFIALTINEVIKLHTKSVAHEAEINKLNSIIEQNNQQFNSIIEQNNQQLNSKMVAYETEMFKLTAVIEQMNQRLLELEVKNLV
jgi:hypothetical protein